MDNQKQIIERLKQANNVLVTVSNNPSVDQLAALLGLGLALTKLDKHAAAVYSGETPSTIEFLQPEDTLEKNTDSLRDFIISLDKSKADKLRYKVEDSVVRIFITPYRTSISDDDLEFSQGDFNVDVVVALGVHDQQDLDQAITTHGRILHDATVVTINTEQTSELGSINWLNDSASSISEMVTAIVNGLGKDVLDEQISTALLTGIVAATDRFSNEKTSATTMKASAVLMAAGANQQLVATKLEEPVEIPEEDTFSYDDSARASQVDTQAETPEAEEIPESPYAQDDGTLQIIHDDVADEPAPELPAPVGDFEEPEHHWPTPPEEEPAPTPEPEADKKDVDETPELPPAPGLTITPEPSRGPIDDLLLPPEEPAELPKISKAFANGESALYEPKITPEHPKSHQLMREGPTFASYDTNIDTEKEDDGFADSFDLPGIDDRDEDKPVNNNSFVLGDHADQAEHTQHTESHPAAKKQDKQEKQEPPHIKVVPPPSDLHDDEPSKDELDHHRFVPRQNETLAEIEAEVHSPYAHLSPYDELDMQMLEHPAVPGKPPVTVDAARDAVEQAMAGSEPERPEPIIALNAQPLGAPLHEASQPAAGEVPEFVPQPVATPVAQPVAPPAPLPMPPSPMQQPVVPTTVPTPVAPVAPAPFTPSTDVPFDLPSPTPAPQQPTTPSFSQQTAPISTAPPVPPPIMPPFPGQ